MRVNFQHCYLLCIALLGASHPLHAQNTAQQVQQQAQISNHPTYPEPVRFPELKKMTAVGIEMFKLFQVSAMINANNLGTDGLCERLGYGGYCADGVDRVYVDLALEGPKKGQLYDLRGARGAEICAIVVATPRNVNGKVNLVDFTPGRCK